MQCINVKSGGQDISPILIWSTDASRSAPGSAYEHSNEVSLQASCPMQHRRLIHIGFSEVHFNGQKLGVSAARLCTCTTVSYKGPVFLQYLPRPQIEILWTISPWKGYSFETQEERTTLRKLRGFLFSEALLTRATQRCTTAIV